MPPEAACLLRLLKLGPGVQLEGAGEYGDVDVLTLRNHRGTGQSHEMLAADQPAKPPDVGIEHDDVAGVALSPEHALGESWHQLAMAAEHAAVGREEHQAVIDRADFGPRIHLVAAERNIGPRLARRVRDALGVVAGDDERVVAKQDAAASPLRQARVPAFGPVRITGEPGLREYHELRPVATGLFDDAAGAHDARRAVHEDRRPLRDGDLDLVVAAQDPLAGIRWHDASLGLQYSDRTSSPGRGDAMLDPGGHARFAPRDIRHCPGRHKR
jgi:hypothetical protein